MKGNAWLIFLATATLECGVVVFGVWLLWLGFTPEERAFVASLWISHAGMPLLALVFLLLLLGLGVNLMFRWYINPLRAAAEETRVIAVSHPGHRLIADGRPELQDLIGSINLLAERYQTLQDDLRSRIQEANAALEEEKNTLAALMAKLTQGVLVCNRQGRILLYNQRAQTLLQGPARRSGGGDWIGLGRSIFGVLDENLLNHALRHIEGRLHQGESNLMAPFVASRPGGQLLSVHLVPILDRDRQFTGYILTLEDITRRTEAEGRRGILLQSLIEGQRSAIASIRAAIETIFEYSQMDQDSHRQFMTVIREESLKLSQHLDQTVSQYAQDLKSHWPLEEMLASDLLAAIERRLREVLGSDIKMSVHLEPVWLKVDSYAIVQAILFVVKQLIERYRAENIALKLEIQSPFACMEIAWKGAALDMETLRHWGKENLMIGQRDSTLTLHDVIERHGGAVWTYNEPQSGGCRMRLLLPLPERHALEESQNGAASQNQDYDFTLFRHSERSLKSAEQALSELAYTVIDTETTGLNPSEGDEIIAFGAVRIVNRRILHREIFDCFVNPRRPVSEAAIAIHGISPSMLRGMPTIDEVLPQFYRFVEDTVIVGHNVAFDMRFLELKEARTGIKFTNPVLDTLLLAIMVHPNQQEHSLEAIARRFGITATGRHTALGDALTTAEVFLALIPLLAERGIVTLGQARQACEHSEYAKLAY